MIFPIISSLPLTSANKWHQLEWSQGPAVGRGNGLHKEVGIRCVPAGLWGSRGAPSLAALGYALPDAHMVQLFLPVLPDHQLDASCTSDSSSLQLYTAGWAHAHLYFWLSKSQVLPKKLTFTFLSPKTVLLQPLTPMLPPNLPLPGSAPCLLPSWHPLLPVITPPPP